MSSTNKTSNLGLNSWIESDKPKRTDFVYDNTVIDRVLGNHVKDSTIHLTEDEKIKVQSPFVVHTIYGTGSEFTRINLGFVPSVVMAFKKNAPYCQDQGSYTKVNSGVATAVGTTGGIEISQDKVIMYETDTVENSSIYSLNEEYAEYILIAFR